MDFLKISLLVLLNLVLVNSIPISDDKEVLEYLQNFGYLTEDEKTSLIDIGSEHKGIQADNRLKRALTNLQENGNIPITGKYDDNTAALMTKPRCGVSDENLISNRHKKYTLMSTKWPNTSLTYRFDHMNKERFVEGEDNIRRIIREAFNVWEKDTVMKFTESKEGRVDIQISFQHPEHIKTHSHRLDHQILGHAFQPGKDLGGDVHLNELINWDFTVSYGSKPEDGKISFYAVLLHLIGHSLGLDHTRDEDAVMNGFYSKRTSTLSEDDIRGMHIMYGTPTNRKYKPAVKQQDSEEEERPVWGRAVWSPDKCHTSYDAIAMIDSEVVAFKGKYMFGPNMDVIEIGSRFRGLTHVDAVYQTTDGKILFFDGQAVYSFMGNKQENLYKLSDFGIHPSVQKIDVIFRRSDNQQIYIFIGEYYYRFDEHKLMITGNRHLIKKLFIDVYGMKTAFTYKDNNTYFFKDEFYYRFIDNTLTLQRMRQKSSAKFFMNCDVEDPMNEATTINYKIKIVDDDYIDVGRIDFENVVHQGLDCDNPEINCGLPSVASFKNVTFIILVIITCILICLIIFYWKVRRC